MCMGDRILFGTRLVLEYDGMTCLEYGEALRGGEGNHRVRTICPRTKTRWMDPSRTDSMADATEREQR